MGKVWRAHHTALKRDDALKVLPDAFAADPDRLARFQREAQVLASLNHPNIAHVYGLEQADGVQALVMELVEGPTLADRIAEGLIPVDEALPIARQIAEALEGAHEQGIIHRDLKPANIKVRPDGTVKVLDFGLAKLAESAPLTRNRSALSMSPTITSPALVSGVGVLLGTAAYMSPEQAKGKPADKRSDIWAFGCVLYEMLAGKRAFDGEDVTETLAAVVKSEPPWDALPNTVSPALRLYLRRCLYKDTRQRIADIHDMRLALEGAFDTPVAGSVVAAVGPRWRRALPLGAALTIGGLIVTGVAWTLWPTPRSEPVTRFTYDVPEGRIFRNIGRPVMAVSPDGRSVVYNTTNGLYLQRMNELEARPIRGTEADLTDPFFSPDGQSVGYWDRAAMQLKRVGLAGGTAVGIAQKTLNPFGASWGKTDTILFGQPDGIMRVSAKGGMPELVVKANKGEQIYGAELLPDGDSILFSAATETTSIIRWDQAQVVVQSLRTGRRTVLLRGGSDAHYVPTGHLLYAVGNALFAIAFDASKLTVTGAAVPVLEGLLRGANATAPANYGVSDDGTLVYATGSLPTLPLGTLVWVDRNGKLVRLSDRQAFYQQPRISPEIGRASVAMTGPDGNVDVWVVDAARGTHTRLTTDPNAEGAPVWTPDGKRIAFASARVGANALHWMPADGSGTAEALTKGTTQIQIATSWLPDGTTLAFYDSDYDIFTVKPGESPVRLFQTPFREESPAFSPDGRWLAYSSDETGRAEIYVTSYPAPGGKTAISTGGGRSPRWSSNGRELFYRNGRQMMVVPVAPGPTLRVGTPKLLFEGDYVQELQRGLGMGPHNYDVTKDGQRFVMIAPASQSGSEQTQTRMVVVQHF